MEWTPILPFMIFRSLAHYRDILLFHGDLRQLLSPELYAGCVSRPPTLIA